MAGYDPIPMLENAGYTEQEAAFLYLVAVHSGYFLRRQFSRFVQRDRGGLADKFIQKALRLDHLQVIECGQARHVYHLTSRPMYQTILRGDSQHRRFKGFAYMQSRLLILDFVLDNLSDAILENEAGKVDFFTARCGVRSELLPRGWAGRAVLFPDGYPIFVSPDGVPRFTFFEDGSVTLTRFERYLDQYRPLLSALRAFELVYLSDVEKSFPFACTAFAAHFTETQVAGVSEQTPLGVEHFLAYLRAREMHEARSWPATGRDLEVLEEGEPIYITLEHQALYAAWKMRSTDAEKIRKRFMQPGPQAKFTTIALPYIYPLFSLKRERKNSEEHGSRVRSDLRSLLEEA
ncbi:MAG TPA: hypothetical protein VK578_19590 [Edaphobacter sp.]|nr:hypothetical protein [Edaphobacter sp.]